MSKISWETVCLGSPSAQPAWRWLGMQDWSQNCSLTLAEHRHDPSLDVLGWGEFSFLALKAMAEWKWRAGGLCKEGLGEVNKSRPWHHLTNCLWNGVTVLHLLLHKQVARAIARLQPNVCCFFFFCPSAPCPQTNSNSGHTEGSHILKAGDRTAGRAKPQGRRARGATAILQSTAGEQLDPVPQLWSPCGHVALAEFKALLALNQDEM